MPTLNRHLLRLHCSVTLRFHHKHLRVHFLEQTWMRNNSVEVKIGFCLITWAWLDKSQTSKWALGIAETATLSLTVVLDEISCLLKATSAYPPTILSARHAYLVGGCGFHFARWVGPRAWIRFGDAWRRLRYNWIRFWRFVSRFTPFPRALIRTLSRNNCPLPSSRMWPATRIQLQNGKYRSSLFRGDPNQRPLGPARKSPVMQRESPAPQ